MCLDPVSRVNCRNSSASNWRPWSVVTLFGDPTLVIQLLNICLTTVSAAMSLIGIASGQRVSLSTIIKQYLRLFDDGRGPTMSTCICSERPVGVAKVPTGVVLWRVIFAFWQLIHMFVPSVCSPSVYLARRNALLPIWRMPLLPDKPIHVVSGMPGI